MKWFPQVSTTLTRSEVIKLVIAWLGWRSITGLVAIIAPKFLAYQPSFPYAFTLLPTYGMPQWLYSWANFDGVHYLTIIEKGYLGTGLIQAFFPAYPLVAAGLNSFLHNALLSGLVVSQLAGLLLAVVWFWWLKTEFSSRVAWIGTAVVWLFPTSFFLGALYTESLFLLLVVGSFLAARWRCWWLVGGLALMAAATRVVGVLLVPALLLELWHQTKDEQHASWLVALRQTLTSQLKNVSFILLGLLGLLGYMAYLHTVFHDALYFFHVQSEFGAGRQENLIVYPQVVWRYIKILLTYQPHDWKFLTLIQEAVVGIAGLGLIAVSGVKVRWSYVLFSLGVFLLPTFTGSFSSLPRYIVPCVSLWLWLALKLSQAKAWVLGLYLICSVLLLVINLVLFIQGYWVA